MSRAPHVLLCLVLTAIAFATARFFPFPGDDSHGSVPAAAVATRFNVWTDELRQVENLPLTVRAQHADPTRVIEARSGPESSVALLSTGVAYDVLVGDARTPDGYILGALHSFLPRVPHQWPDIDAHAQIHELGVVVAETHDLQKGASESARVLPRIGGDERDNWEVFVAKGEPLSVKFDIAALRLKPEISRHLAFYNIECERDYIAAVVLRFDRATSLGRIGMHVLMSFDSRMTRAGRLLHDVFFVSSSLTETDALGEECHIASQSLGGGRVCVGLSGDMPPGHLVICLAEPESSGDAVQGQTLSVSRNGSVVGEELQVSLSDGLGMPGLPRREARQEIEGRSTLVTFDPTWTCEGAIKERGQSSPDSAHRSEVTRQFSTWFGEPWDGAKGATTYALQMSGDVRVTGAVAGSPSVVGWSSEATAYGWRGAANSHELDTATEEGRAYWQPRRSYLVEINEFETLLPACLFDVHVDEGGIELRDISIKADAKTVLRKLYCVDSYVDDAVWR